MYLKSLATAILLSSTANAWDGKHDIPHKCDPYNPKCEGDDMSCVKQVVEGVKRPIFICVSNNWIRKFYEYKVAIN